MVARNRLMHEGAISASRQLRESGIDAMLFKGTALIGRCLPPQGLRSIADIDIWVRPSQRDEALRCFGSRSHWREPKVKAELVHDPIGREIDIHYLPSHLLPHRMGSEQEAERLFENSWNRRIGLELELSDLVYYSTLNPLFQHPPRSTRASFTLIELDSILTRIPASKDVIARVVAKAISDATVPVFIDHFDWLGRGASPALDAIYESFEAAQSDDEKARRPWFQHLHMNGDIDSGFTQNRRLVALIKCDVTSTRMSVLWFIFQGYSHMMRQNPRRFAGKFFRKSAWRNFFMMFDGLVRFPR